MCRLCACHCSTDSCQSSQYPLCWCQGRMPCRYYGGTLEDWPLKFFFFFFFTWAVILLPASSEHPAMAGPFFLSPFLTLPSLMPKSLTFWASPHLISTQVQAAAGAGYPGIAGSVWFARHHIHLFEFRFLLK